MSWQLVHTISFYQFGDPFLIDCLFKNSLLIIQAICPTAKPTWHKAGLIRPMLDVPDIGLVKGNYQLISLEAQLIDFSWLTATVPEFKLEFLLYEWIPEITLTFWKPKMSLYPINPPDSNPNSTNSFTPITANVTTTVSKILPANPLRKDVTIYNSDNKTTVYLDLTSSVSTTSAAFAIPPGNNWTLDFDWTGDIYAVTKSATAAINIREFV